MSKKWTTITKESAGDLLRVVRVKKLRVVGLSREQIGGLDFESIRMSVVKLEIKDALMRKVPKNVFGFENVVNLNLEGNGLKNVPSMVFTLKFLRNLNLRHNSIDVLPKRVKELQNLECLDISDNEIMFVPYEITETSVKIIKVENNPMISPPVDICSKGTTAIFRYLKNMRYAKMNGGTYYPVKTNRMDNWFPEGIIPNLRNIKKNFEIGFYAYSCHSLEQGKRDYMEDTISVLNPVDQKYYYNQTSDQFERHTPKKGLFTDLDFQFSEKGKSNSSDCEPSTIKVRRRVHSANHTPSKKDIKNKPTTHDIDRIGLFSVFDGHGGEFASEYLEKKFNKKFLENTDEIKTKSYQAALRNTFLKVDKEILDYCRPERNDGSTGSVILVSGNHLHTAHVGDSRVVLCRGKGAVELCTDHKPDRDDERARIEESGGYVHMGYTARVNGSLAVSRAFGDIYLKEPVPYIISDPEMGRYKLSPQDHFIIMASDGLWDVVSNTEAVDYVRKETTISVTCDLLIQKALKYQTSDNVSVLVIYFYWTVQPRTKKKKNNCSIKHVSLFNYSITQ